MWWTECVCKVDVHLVCLFLFFCFDSCLKLRFLNSDEVYGHLNVLVLGPNTCSFNHFWLTWKMWVSVMISVRLAGPLSICGIHFDVGIFSDTTDVVNIKLCIMVVLIEVYPFIPLSVTLIVFQRHRASDSFNWKFKLVKLKLCTIVDYIKLTMNIPLILIFTHVQGR